MKKSAIVVSAIVIAFCTIVSCQKHTDCKATVRCVDSTGAPLKNTSVLLYAPVKKDHTTLTYTADVKASGVTDENGLVNFTFKLPAIFDIKATSSVSSNTLSGAGLIRLEEGKGSEQTITLK